MANYNGEVFAQITVWSGRLLHKIYFQMQSGKLWTECYRSLFGRYKSTTLTLLNFMAYSYGEVFAPTTVCSGLVMKQIICAISKCGVEYFEQSTMDLHLELTIAKAQHSWILWVVAIVMYVLQSLFSFTKQNSLDSVSWNLMKP